MFTTHLESALDGTRFEAGKVHTVHQGRPLWVRYDLDGLKKNFTKKALFGRPPTIWRYLEMLPIRNPDKIVSLTETITPILETRRLAARFGTEHLFLKDESRLPTGSFKARGMAMAVSMANEFGLQRLAVPTAGNAGGALAAYAARAGMDAYVFMPDDTPAIAPVTAMCPRRSEGKLGSRTTSRASTARTTGASRWSPSGRGSRWWR